jgi:hypothetical protein
VFFSPWHKHACHLDLFLSNDLFTSNLSYVVHSQAMASWMRPS